MFISSPRKIHIHIGTHKTGTTHFQDSLELGKEELKHNNIIYFPRDEYRLNIRRLTHTSVLSDLKLNAFKEIFISKKLFSKNVKNSLLLISEENILGDCIDLLDITPYDMTKLEFISILSKKIDVTIFLSIRDFSRLLPAAYATSIKYVPKRAFVSKQKLLKDIDDGFIPSWIDIYNRIQTQLPNAKIKLWTQEFYRDNSDIVFKTFTQKKDFVASPLTDPSTTVTPSFRAISEVEEIVNSEGFERPVDWPAKVESVFTEYKASQDTDKFSFFDEREKSLLKKQYESDLSFFRNEKDCLIE